MIEESYSVEIIADSVNEQGTRLTSMIVCYPRFIHAELLTHRVFSRNASSSRAIPIDRMIDTLTASPIHYGANKSGMSSDHEIEDIDAAKAVWQEAKASAITHALKLKSLGIHKQIMNRILEPFMTIKVIVSATEWTNFFSLRISPAAQPELNHIATMMKAAMDKSTPRLLKENEWHLPFIDKSDDGLDLETKRMISVSCCAAVSYRRLDKTVEKAKRLHDMLLSEGHASAFEHMATPGTPKKGNFVGYVQYREIVGL